MKDKKIITLIIFSLGVLFLIIYFSGGFSIYKKNRLESNGRKNATEEKDKELINSLVAVNLALKEDINKNSRALEKESQRAIILEEKAKNLFVQNESLGLELKTAKLISQELSASTGHIKERLKSLDEELAANKYSPAQADKIKAQLRSVYKGLGSVDTDIQKLLQQAKGYKVLADDSQKLLNVSSKELEAVKKGLAEGKSRNSDLEKELALRLTEFEKVKGAKSELEQGLEELKRKNDSLNNEVNRLEGDLKASQAKAALADEGKDQVSRLKEEISRLQDDLKTAQFSAARAAQEKSQLLEEKNQILKQNEEQKISRVEAQRRASLLNEDIAKLDGELISAQEKIAKLTEEKEQLIKQKDDALFREKESSSANQDLLNRISKLTEANMGLGRELNLVKSEVERIEVDYTRIRRDYAKATAYLLKNRKDSARRAQMILQYQDKEAELKAKVEELKLNLEAQFKESAALREQMVGGQLENQNLREQLSQLGEKQKGLQNRWQRVSDLLKKAGEEPIDSDTPSKNVSIVIEENKDEGAPVLEKTTTDNEN